MGAWGVGHFENDTACDWVYALEETSDFSAIESAIDAVFEDDYVEADVGCEALAAIDTLARLRGKPGQQDSYTESVDEWVNSVNLIPSAELIDKSIKAIDLIGGSDSELAELWGETEELDAWKLELEGLRERVSS